MCGPGFPAALACLVIAAELLGGIALILGADRAHDENGQLNPWRAAPQRVWPSAIRRPTDQRPHSEAFDIPARPP